MLKSSKKQSFQMGKKIKSIQLPKELHLSIWLATACRDANLESGLHLLSCTNRAVFGAQVK